MAHLTLFVAIAISAVAAWYSIAGLTAIFASAVIPIIIMGSVLEIGKLVTASWLYQNWKTTPTLLKAYLTSAVIVLMFITSMGIFGFLSKAHIEQTISTSNNDVLITQLESKIEREQKKIDDATTVIEQLDRSVQTLMEYDRIRGPDGAIAVRESQKNERAELNRIINDSSELLSSIQSEKAKLYKEQIVLEAEVGPIKYIAEIIYGESDKELIEKSVRWTIFVIIFVFDPLAVLLLIAANQSLKEEREAKARKIQNVSVASVNPFDPFEDFSEETRELEESTEEKSEEPPKPSTKSLHDQLAEVDKQLKEVYNDWDIGNKNKKRDLERIRAKIVKKIQQKRGSNE